MSSIIVFYSFGGSTRKFANEMANEKKLDILEITEKKKRNIITAFIPGCVQAGKGSASKINEIEKDFGKYDEIVLAGPIWASNPAPALYSFIENYLPEGKKIKVYLLSQSGTSEHEIISKKIQDKKCELIEIVDVDSKEFKKD